MHKKFYNPYGLCYWRQLLFLWGILSKYGELMYTKKNWNSLYQEGLIPSHTLYLYVYHFFVAIDQYIDGGTGYVDSGTGTGKKSRPSHRKSMANPVCTFIDESNPPTPQAASQIGHGPWHCQGPECRTGCLQTSSSLSPSHNTGRQGTGQSHMGQLCSWVYLSYMEEPASWILCQQEQPILICHLGS